MDKKKKKTKEETLIPVHIYGIWDKVEKKLKYITLDEESIDFEMLLLDENQFSLGEFDIYLDIEGC